MMNKKNALHYKWGSDCDSWVFCNSNNLSVKLETMPPRSTEEIHLHSLKEQFFFVLNGTATFSLEDVKYNLMQNEGIRVAPGLDHGIANESERDLKFLVITTPNVESDRINKI